MDKQLEMVAKIETDRQSNASKIGDSEGSMNTLVSYVDDGADVDGEENLDKIKAVMTKLNAESEKITQMLNQIQNTTSTSTSTVAEIQSQAIEMLLVSFDIFHTRSNFDNGCLVTYI